MNDHTRTHRLLDAIRLAQNEFILESNSSRTAFRLLLDELLSLTESEYGFIGEVERNDGKKSLRVWNYTDISWNEETRRLLVENAATGLVFDNMDTLFGHAIVHNEVVIANNPKSDPRSGALPLGHPELNAFLGIPFHYGKELIGLIGIANRPGGYSSSDVEFLAPLVTTCGILAHSRQVAEEQKRTQFLKEEADRMQRLIEFSQKLAHDMNNLLTVIQGTVEAHRLQNTEGMSDEDVERIDLATKRASTLAKRILNFAGSTAINRQSVSLSELLREVKTICEPIASPSVQIVFECEPEIPAVSADASALQQAVTNMVFNSIEAIGSQPGIVNIGAKLRDESVVVEVADNGSGMDETTRRRAFEPYFSTKSNDRGFGLGSVLGFVNSHSAKLDVETQESRGTRIEIALPISKVEKQGGAVKPNLRFEGLRVLVVDDQKEVLVAVEKLLRGLNATVLTASSGEESLYELTSFDADLILMDVSMPQMDGFETAKRLRKRDPQLPVVFMSGHAKSAVPSELATAGKIAFLNKPFSLDELQSACKSVFGP